MPENMIATDAITFDDRDEFHRKPIAEKLIRLLTSEIPISPMVIDGQWGSGKTEFCLKMINLLEEKHPEIKVAYIDAFKADHANEPLMTLIAKISNLIKDEEKASNFRNKAIPVIRYILTTASKAGIAWILKKNADDIADELEDVLQEAAEDSINSMIAQSLKDHRDIEATLATLKEALKQIAEDTSLILFIDELDRCKPDFAIAMLENIKHVFDVPNINFVLVSNLKQLEDSINHCYGIGVNAQKYLDKFIRYSLRLPAECLSDQTLAAIRHAEGLIEKSALLEKAKFLANTKIAPIAQFLAALIKENKLSLREVESLVRHMEIAQLFGGEEWFTKHFGVLLLRLIGVYIYCFEKDIADNLVSGKSATLDITGTFGIRSFADADRFDNRPSHQQIMAGFLMSENSDGVEGIPGGDIRGDTRWKEALQSNRGKYFDNSHVERECREVIAETVRMLRLGVVIDDEI